LSGSYEQLLSLVPTLRKEYFLIKMKYAKNSFPFQGRRGDAAWSSLSNDCKSANTVSSLKLTLRPCLHSHNVFVNFLIYAIFLLDLFGTY